MSKKSKPNTLTADAVLANSRKLQESVNVITQDASLLVDAVLLRVTVHEWGNRRKVKAGSEKEAARLRRIKTLIRCPEYDKLGEYLNKVFGDTPRSWINRYTLASGFLDGVRKVKTDEVERVERKLKRVGRMLREVLVPKLVAAYPDAKLNAQAEFAEIAADTGQPTQYLESDYPSPETLATKYGIEWSWFSIGVPAYLPQQIRQAEQNKLEEQFRKAREECISALRACFAEIISRATERLTNAPGEREKVFRDTLIQNIEAFCGSFANRNIYRDGELEKLVEQARAAVRGVAPQQLRDNEGLRDKVAKTLTVVQQQMDDLLTTKPTRRITFDE